MNHGKNIWHKMSGCNMVVQFLILFLLTSSVTHATNYYWIGAANGSWKSKSNWSLTSGGASAANRPGSGDVAIFDGGASTNCVVDSLVNVLGIQMNSGYNDTIKQNAYTFAVGTSGWSVNDGVFWGSSSNITITTGSFTMTGGEFCSTSGVMSTTGGLFFNGGTFTHNSGTVEMKATDTLNGSPTFYKFSVSPTAAVTTITINNSPVVSNTFTMGGSRAITLNTGTLNVSGNVTITNTQTAGGGTATVNINGTGSQTLTGSGTNGTGVLPKVTINKSSDTLHLVSVISVLGHWTYTAGTVDAGTSTVYFRSSLTVSGSHSLYNIITTTSVVLTISSGTTLTVLNNWNAFSTQFQTGTINLKGDLIVNSTATGFSGGTLIFSGNGNQLFDGQGGVGTGQLVNVTIAKNPSDTLFLEGNISIRNGTWRLDSGIVDAGTSSILMNSMIVIGDQTWNNLNFTCSASSTIDNLIIEGSLLFNASGAGIALHGDTLFARGDITIQNLGVNTGSQSGTIVIDGTGNQTFTGNGTAGSGMLCEVIIKKTSGTLTLVSTISMRGNWTYTSGTVDAVTNTSGVVFYGSNTVDAQGTSSTMSFYNAQVYAGTVTLAGNLRTVNNFLINTSSTCAPGSNTIFVGGTWNNNGTFTAGTSTVTFEGSGYRAIKKASTALETFYNLTLNRTFEAGSALLLNTPVKVTNSLTLTRGKIKAKRTGGTPFYFELADNATVSGGGDSAFVYGPLRKTGNDTFSFPLGDTLTTVGAYHPIKISAPSSATDQFEAEYVGKTADSSGYSTAIHDTTLASVSTCGFWKLQRRVGSSNVVATINANINNTCDDPDINEMRIAAWDTVGTDHWKDLGDANRAVTDNLVSVASTASITLPMTTDPIPIANAKKANNIIYATLRRKLDGGYFQITNAQLYFRYDEEYNDTDGKLTFNVYNDDHEKITSNSIIGPVSLIPSIAYGDNRCHLNMFGCYVLNGGGFLLDGFYILEVINEKNEKWYLRFKNTNGIAVPACSNTWGS